MSNFKLYDIDDAPEGARETLKQAKEKFGFVPNLLKVMAESPALAKAYMAVSNAFEESSLNPVEQQVVLLTVSTYHECHYCVAAHSAVADMVDMPSRELEALRSGQKLSDTRLEALRNLTRSIVDTRGWPSADAVEEFLDAGYERKNIFDVLVGVGQKTLSNYTNHIAETPLDEPFQPKEWKKAS